MTIIRASCGMLWMVRIMIFSDSNYYVLDMLDMTACCRVIAGLMVFCRAINNLKISLLAQRHEKSNTTRLND